MKFHAFSNKSVSDSLPAIVASTENSAQIQKYARYEGCNLVKSVSCVCVCMCERDNIVLICVPF